MSELNIRRATEADWPSMWPIWNQVVVAGDTYTYEPDTTFEVARQGWLEESNVETWLAEIDGRVAGFYKITPNQTGPGSHVANGSYMVDADVRGHGVGRRMVVHSLEAARAAGYEAMQFNAVVETNVGAIGLYERLGFVTIGIVPNAFRHPVAGRVGLRIMYRELTA
jgi:ribosomal protein S18 acetylase RimI-like enzyme